MIMKYPIGIKDFESIINGGYVYVDKTATEVTKASSFLIQQNLVPTFSTYWNFLSH